ncbi:hypothetical protein FACS18949_17830 [Clostridia bacterium]|nr:hypothetical protein FACS18949_17830 [Clostridia bacterium]
MTKMHSRSTRGASPYVAWMILFTAIPLLLVIYFAFTDGSGRPTLENLTGLGNYSTVFF